MKILHLLSNWKWTAVSEPAVDLAIAQKALGAEALFVCGKSPEGHKYDVLFHSRQKGLNHVDAINLPKHLQIHTAIQDARKLRKIINNFKPDIVHSHMKNAHFLGFLARGKSKPPFSVRSCYDPQGPGNDIRSRFLNKHFTDGLVVIGKTARQKAVETCGLPSNAILITEPGIDLDRFSPDRKITFNRKDFGLTKENFVVGVVSRIRPSRRIDIPLTAIASLVTRFPQLRFFLVGRGNRRNYNEVVEKPLKEMGIADKVILPGYCRDDRLVSAYQAMDVLVYPIPGTDKSCRTVREAMASGIPVIAPEIGFLKDLIENGVNGKFMDLSSESLARILSNLIKDNRQLQMMAHQSLKTAKQRFSMILQAEKILMFYEKILNGKVQK
ncbi:MAG: glycosyltransferase family 4 protein [Thermodesulfobacteriota bacterium]|nr:glycosyltransferase family 4 protein [Thermodesulfobacteriota bacterium]